MATCAPVGRYRIGMPINTQARVFIFQKANGTAPSWPFSTACSARGFAICACATSARPPEPRGRVGPARLRQGVLRFAMCRPTSVALKRVHDYRKPSLMARTPTGPLSQLLKTGRGRGTPSGRSPMGRLTNACRGSTPGSPERSSQASTRAPCGPRWPPTLWIGRADLEGPGLAWPSQRVHRIFHGYRRFRPEDRPTFLVAY
jgi:hypothetical protein